MVNKIKNDPTPSINDMRTRYQNAQALMQGFFTKNIAFNTTLIPRWIDNTGSFWYERELREGRQFRLVDSVAKTNQLAFDHKALADALATGSGRSVSDNDLPITKLRISLNPLNLEFCAFDTEWTFDPDKNLCVADASLPSSWSISPDGSKAAFIRDHNIWLRHLDTGKEYALTDDGEEFYCYAIAPSAWGLKISTSSFEGLWSPDSSRLFTIQIDTRFVNTLPMVQHVPTNGDLRPNLVCADRRLAFPGDKYIDEQRYLAIDVNAGEQQPTNYHPCPIFRNAAGFFSSGHGWWHDDGRHAYFIELTRGGDHIARLIEFDTQNGNTRVIIEEECSSSCFKLRLDSRTPIHTQPLPGTDEVLWFSERSGWGHLYLYCLKSGQLKNPITKGDWVVREVHHFDPIRRELVIQTSGRKSGSHAYYRDICLVNIDTGELTELVAAHHDYVIFDSRSELAGNLGATRDITYGAGVSPDHNYIVTTRSRADEVPVSVLIDREGCELMELERADVTNLPENWQWPEPVKMLAADDQTDIYGVVYRPADFSPEQSYPILDFSWSNKEGCAIPCGSFTNNAVAGVGYFWPAALAQLGFIVVDIYGRGTAGRSRAFFEADLDPKLPSSINEHDRVAGIKQLAQRYPYMDLNRVGAGGLVSTSVPISSLLGHPDFYKVGVSNGASFDIEMSSAFYGESYGDLPATRGVRPALSTWVTGLRGKLLLMHGMMHATVPVAQTLRIVDALQAANKDFDLLLLPNEGYGMNSYAIRRSWDFFVINLLGLEPPKEFNLTTSMDIIREMKRKQMTESSA